MIDPRLDASFRAFAAARRYGQATLDRWARLDGEDAAALLRLIEDLRPGENQLRDVWDWSDDVAARDGIALAQVLDEEPVVAARRRAVSRNDKLKLVKHALRRLRFPQLAATEDRLADLIRALALPRTVRVTLPDFLEGDTVRVEITAGNVAALQAAAAALLTEEARQGWERVFGVLGGEAGKA